MLMDKQFEAIRNYVHRIFAEDATGHDYEHMKRVAGMAREIAIHEGIDPFLCEVAAWLHDIGDRKLFTNPELATAEMNELLTSIHFSKQQIDEINQIISTVSFQKGLIPVSIEGKIVQDADRIDALGAIGIARTFQYGGANNQPIYQKGNRSTSVQHFYDKLLKIKDLMHTNYAKRLAAERHAFMENFLEQFYKEWI